MIEQIEQLEERVESIMRVLDAIRQENHNLRLENEELRRRVDVAGDVNTEKELLQTQVEELEGKVEGMASKETQIRDRLHTILERIDVLERDIGTESDDRTHAMSHEATAQFQHEPSE